MENLLEFYPEQMYEIKDSNRPGILATLTGPCFFPDLPSRNTRVYPYKAWENALKNPYTLRLLENNLMLGTVGHKEMEFDELISEQKVSHLTRKLWITENNGAYPEIKSKYIGLGEVDVLDTPVGRILNTLVRAKCKLGISSKSYGEYNSKDTAGNQIVDENKFFCQRFDFVVDPGYLQAMPQLKEAFDSLDYILKNKHPLEEKMDKIVEKMDSLMERESKKEVKEEIEETKIILEETMEKDMQKLIEEKVNLEHQMEDVLKTNKDLQKTLANYDEIGTPEEITEALEKAKDLGTQLMELGTIPEIREALMESNQVIEDIAEIGTIEKIREVFTEYSALTESLKDIGTVEEITEAFDKVKTLTTQLAEIGTVSDIREALLGSKQIMTEYREIGTVAEIKEAFEKAGSFVQTLKEKAEKEQVTELVNGFGISEEKATKYLGKMTLKEAQELLADMVEANKITERYNKIDEKIEEKPNQTRVSRLYEAFGKKA